MSERTDMDRPQTPREFILMDRIRFLQRALDEGHYNARETMWENYNPDPAIITLPKNHPHMMKVANVKAEKIGDSWRTSCRGYTEDPCEYYEISSYFPDPGLHGFASSTVLSHLHQKFVEKLGSDLLTRFGDIWAKYKS